jgi:hypothetical protein
MGTQSYPSMPEIANLTEKVQASNRPKPVMAGNIIAAIHAVQTNQKPIQQAD